MFRCECSILLLSHQLFKRNLCLYVFGLLKFRSVSLSVSDLSMCLYATLHLFHIKHSTSFHTTNHFFCGFTVSFQMHPLSTFKKFIKIMQRRSVHTHNCTQHWKCSSGIFGGVLATEESIAPTHTLLSKCQCD